MQEIIDELKKLTQRLENQPDPIEFRKELLDINGKIQGILFACTLGMGSEKALRENIARLNKLCQSLKGDSDEQDERNN